MAYMYLDSLAINYIDWLRLSLWHHSLLDIYVGMCVFIYLFCKPTLHV